MLKKRVGKTVKEAMESINSEFGDDVVIISTKEALGNYEVFFASPHDIEGLTKTQPSAEQKEPLRIVKPFSVEKLGESLESASHDLAGSRSQDDITQSLVKEVSQIKQMIQEQWNTMNWQSFASGDPVRGKIWHDLIDVGFSPVVSRTVTQAIPDGLDLDKSTAWTIEALTHQLESHKSEMDLVQSGGVFALVGPTGSGKTTTIAKIAARCIAMHGKQSIALITTDTYRIGAIDQLRTYGKVLGVPVHVCLNDQELSHQLQSLKSKHLVLIDTMGLSPRDNRTESHVEVFDREGVQKVFVMNVSMQPRALSEAAERFKGKGFYGAILTKLDECSQVAGSLDVALRHKLNLIYISTGQRVPEDIYTADPHFLIKRAMRNQYEKAYAKTEQETLWARYGSAVGGVAEGSVSGGKEKTGAI